MIDILLSTYNGQEFLREQIDSILSQTYSQWRLIVRDDVSSDQTNEILEEYVNRYPDKIVKVIDNLGNIGCIKSYETLLNQSSSEYIMFSDQDDVWLPNKIELSMKKMIQLESKYNDTPLLVHADLIVVDENLNLIANSFWSYTKIFPEILDNNKYYLAIRNSVTGCTMLINKLAKGVALPFASNVEMHDAWIAINVVLSGKVDYIREQVIMYRQHSENVYGAKAVEISIRQKILNLYSILKININHYKYYSFVFKSPIIFLMYKLFYFIKIYSNKSSL